MGHAGMDDDFTTIERLVRDDYENREMAEQERNDFDEPDDLPPSDADPTSKDDLDNGNAAENEAEPSWDALSPEEQEAIMEDVEAADRHSTDTNGQAQRNKDQGLGRTGPRLDDAALHGLAGRIVKGIDPYTEADPAATLTNFLTAFGNCINAAPHAIVLHSNHPARLFIVQVGVSSKGRKGTGWSPIRHIFSTVDPGWAKDRIKTGLSSGEGVIYVVRDALYKQEPIKGHKGKVEGYQQVLKEEAVEDKRLMIIEEEFASVLNVMNRVGNTLSPVIRQGWDGGTLSTLVRNNPLAATNPHISIVGHITKDELLARLDDTSKANGFANRFLWVWVERSKLLPDAPPIPDHILEPLIDQLRKTIEFARKTNALTRDECASALWHEVYADLSAGQQGLLGAVLSRAEAQVLRLSVAYALLDLSVTIRRDHIQAALALWKYCEEGTVKLSRPLYSSDSAGRN